MSEDGTRLSEEELQAVVQAARREFTRFDNYGGDGMGPIIALLLIDFSAALKEQNRLLADILTSKGG